MVETEKLEKLIAKCHIIKEIIPLPESILGYYYYDGSYYVIFINESIKGNERLYRTVLAEEIGHYRTTIGDITPRKYMCYTDRLEIDKKELAALRWATDFLIPTDMLLDAIKKKVVSSLHDMADYFMVTEQLVKHKLEFMAKQKVTWKLDDTRSLYLASLPSLFIYESR